MRPTNLAVACLSLILGSAFPLLASDVSIQKLHEDVGEGSVDYYRYSINGIIYQSAAFSDWTVTANYSGMDFAIISSKFSSSFIGFKTAPCVDPKGKPATQISQAMLDALAESLKSPNVRYEGTTPTLNGDVDMIDFDLKRIEENETWQCHYRLKVVGEVIWIMASEVSPTAAAAGSKVFTMLEGTFSKISP